MKRADNLRHVLYESGLSDNRIVRAFLSLSGPGFIPFSDDFELKEKLQHLRESGTSSKDVLILREFRGRVFQKCPGSRGMICCNYYLVNTCFDCLYGCSYCFLRSYLNSYGITQFTNPERIFEEITGSPEYKSGRPLRVGTGEFTDSLMFDEVTGIASGIINFFASRPAVIPEFKTKSDNIGHLLDIRDKGKSVLAWSLNRQDMIDIYEKDTASLEHRILAAGRAAESGYYVAFHLDPLIFTDNSSAGYEDIIDRVFNSIDPERILWISMGGLRFTPDFKEILRFSGQDERLILSEMLTGPDGKMRYLKHERIRVYRSLLERIEAAGGGRVFVYMCMESSEVWEAVFGVRYRSSGDLENAFIENLKERGIF